MWETEVEGNVSKIDVNENGYVSIILKGTTYKSVIVVYDAKGNELESANNTFFTYQIEIPFKVKKYEILRKKVNLSD